MESCANCIKDIESSKAFKKHVIDIKNHPNEFREKHFCSIACLRNFLDKNRKEITLKTQQTCKIYDWGGGVGGC